ncbi:MAG: LuxR C-terminal-related transcriptional regulator [Syntrophobacteraceae bacterium]
MLNIIMEVVMDEGKPMPYPAQLRDKAEKKLLSQEDLKSDSLSLEEARRVQHELRVHQIELEMQNEELRNAQAALEISRVRYFDLYNLAPVGYCTLSANGLILEANLTAAALLGVVRGELINGRFSRFIHTEDQDISYLHFKRVFEGDQRQVCELRVLREHAESFWARLESIVGRDEDDAPICRMVISDISEGKGMEEELRKSRQELEQRLGELAENAKNLQEVNIALKVMLNHKENYQKEFGEIILSNIRTLVSPYLEKLKRTNMSSAQATLIEILESNFGKITSPFIRTIGIEAADLTPTELQVAAFIRDGKTTAEIAEILCASERTVESHRLNIRKKLGLQGRAANLRSHLLMLT